MRVRVCVGEGAIETMEGISVSPLEAHHKRSCHHATDSSTQEKMPEKAMRVTARIETENLPRSYS